MNIKKIHICGYSLGGRLALCFAAKYPELIESLLDELYWYDREMFKLYHFGEINGKRYTLQSLADKTGISRRSIFTTIKNVKTYIKKRINEIRRFD